MSLFSFKSFGVHIYSVLVGKNKRQMNYFETALINFFAGLPKMHSVLLFRQ